MDHVWLRRDVFWTQILERKLRTRKIALLDCDGPMRNVAWEEGRPAPNPALLPQLQRLRQAGLEIVIVSGAPYSSIAKTLRHLPNTCNTVFGEHGATAVHTNGTTWVAPLSSADEQQTFEETQPQFLQIAERHGCLMIPTMGSCFVSHARCKNSFKAACAETQGTISYRRHLFELRQTPNDRGVVVAPRSCDKQSVVNSLLGREFEIVFGAGDTGTDLPLLEKAGFAAICRGNPTTSIDPKLASLASAIEAGERNGYVARKKDETNGVGLAKAIEVFFDKYY